MKKAISLSAMVAALGLWLAAPALAATYPPTAPTATVNDTTVTAGQQVTLSGAKWCPGSKVDITLQPGGIDLGSATVGQDGTFTQPVQVPSNLAPGSYTLVLSGSNANCNPATKQITLVLAAAGVTTAATGANLSLVVPLFAGLIVAGLVALVSIRRRRTAVHR